MAIGVMGMPLKKGQSQQIETCKLAAAPEITGSKAGLCVFAVNSDGVKQTEVVAADATTTANNEFYGILNTDISADAATPSNGFIVGVVLAGLSIPVQIKSQITDLTAGVAFTATGKIVQADDAAAVQWINARCCSTEVYKALDENGNEVDCQLINLFNNGDYDLPVAP